MWADETASDDKTATFSFRVADSGAGILPAEQERIFESFEQVGNNASKSQGTGLGLPISRSIVEMMGGNLCLKSQLGKGSEFFFTVTLPLADLDDCTENEFQVPEADGLLNGLNILLAEDNDLNAEIAIELLEFKGAAVYRCEDGKRAVEHFERSKPYEFQFILMDIQMPVMNGFEAAHAIRALEREDAAAIPIIAMTANTFKEDKDAAMEAGMNEFLTKPLDVHTLYQLLYGLMQENDKSQE